MSESAGARVAAWLRADPWRFDVAVAIATLVMATLLIAGASERFDTGWPEVVAGVGAFGLVLMRRRFPLPLLAIAMTWTAVHIVIWERPTPVIFATIVLLASACVLLERWEAIALGAGVGLCLYVLGLIGNDAELADARAVIGIAWAAMAVGIADAIRSWRRFRESAEAQLLSTVVAAEARTRQQVSEERLAIARELHDLLAHNLSVMNVQTGAALHLLRVDPDRAEESLTEARDAGRNVLDELRELLGVLRDDDSDDVPRSSLPMIDRLDDLVETMRSAGLRVEWSRSGEPRALTPAASLAAYRIVQEALTNAAKHGTGAVELGMRWTDRELAVRVENHPESGDAPGGGHGLIGMRERAAANGGELTAGRVGNVFVVDAWLPVAAERVSERRVDS